MVETAARGLCGGWDQFTGRPLAEFKHSNTRVNARAGFFISLHGVKSLVEKTQ
jgi:hypothetical protein